MKHVSIMAALLLLCALGCQTGGEKVLFADNFSELSGEWTWLREDPEDWRIRNGALEIRARPGDANTVRNALLRPVPGAGDGALAFEVTVTFTETPTEQYEQAGLTWYHDGEPEFKIVHELVDDEIVIIPGRVPTDSDTVRLRLVVDGNRYTAQFREEGETEYRTVDEGELAVGSNDHISIQCYHGPEDADHWMRFTGFRIVRLPRDDA